MSQNCWSSICKLRPNDGNILKQHIATLLDATCWTRLACCYVLRIESWSSTHARVQHCCTNLTKRLQHHATSTNVAWKIWPLSNLNMSQHIATEWPNARNMLRPILLQYVALKCCDRLAGALHDWLKKLAPLFFPIRSKSKTNRYSVARVFPRFSSAKCTPCFDWFTVLPASLVIG